MSHSSEFTEAREFEAYPSRASSAQVIQSSILGAEEFDVPAVHEASGLPCQIRASQWHMNIPDSAKSAHLHLTYRSCRKVRALLNILQDFVTDNLFW